jgi:hypothetical protein
VHYFLRALERTGDVRASAEDAGIDHTTAYLRRRTQSGLCGRVGAGAGRASRAGRAGKAEGHDRWSDRKEKLFFDELAATANVKRSARAAGVSPQAVFARRLRDARFRAKWAAVLETGRAAIEMQLVERAKKSFDPDEHDFGEAEPRVSIAEALRIVQQSGKAYAPAFVERPGFEDDGENVHERLIHKLLRLKKRRAEEQLREGWSRDEESGLLIPPGWVKTSDGGPMEPEDRDY